ncbi:hypothetical protein [Pseudomonas chlororaphis]|nr:Acetyl-CoA acetyltransferase [Pseudomonas chlororaphis subsp. aureofaciens]AZE02582.1 Acetyl-CoA acetyltransferase [Pseudomonas chlororaphis subsp. aureofaciens]AZE39778.1 Acetyl-CoA acetyltransferase [Pseudomonas chlororaphis subsp. aureofaciens]QQX62161.1 hypothetical protein JHW28_01920 [Pseudomonas chlororaphis subsp. aurantiaca]
MLNDGAAVWLLGSREIGMEHGVVPMARILSSASVSLCVGVAMVIERA